MDRIDWTTVDGCERCNEHGPFAPWEVRDEQVRDLHQAWHAFVAELLRAARIPQLVAFLARRL